MCLLFSNIFEMRDAVITLDWPPTVFLSRRVAGHNKLTENPDWTL
jgi:hypothetical protein